MDYKEFEKKVTRSFNDTMTKVVKEHQTFGHIYKDMADFTKSKSNPEAFVAA